MIPCPPGVGLIRSSRRPSQPTIICYSEAATPLNISPKGIRICSGTLPSPRYSLQFANDGSSQARHQPVNVNLLARRCLSSNTFDRFWRHSSVIRTRYGKMHQTIDNRATLDAPGAHSVRFRNSKYLVGRTIRLYRYVSGWRGAYICTGVGAV